MLKKKKKKHQGEDERTEERRLLICFSNFYQKESLGNTKKKVTINMIA
jgi:hypothetical protein